MSSPAPVAELVAQLQDADPGVRRRAADSLGQQRDVATLALDALALALDDPDGDVRLAAIHAIAGADPVAAEGAIAWALESPDYRVAVAAHQLVQGTARLRGPDSTVWRDPSIGRSE